MTNYQPTTATDTAGTDDEQLRALFQWLCQAWTDGDAAAYGACFTADCDYISFDGTRAHGRDSVVESHDKLFRGVLFGTALVGEIESIRYVADDVAVLHGNGSVLVAWRTKLPKRRLTRNTLVAVRGPEGLAVHRYPQRSDSTRTRTGARLPPGAARAWTRCRGCRGWRGMGTKG